MPRKKKPDATIAPLYALLGLSDAQDAADFDYQGQSCYKGR